jgi:hypothetical protein
MDHCHAVQNLGKLLLLATTTTFFFTFLFPQAAENDKTHGSILNLS